MRLNTKSLFLALICLCSFSFCSNNPKKSLAKEKQKNQFNPSNTNDVQKAEKDTATFAAGCFWCVEEHFRELKGVEQVTSGYIGGKEKNPDYKIVSSGNTLFAEACMVVYDPNTISFDELLEVFFFIHDPTQLDRQGNDEGKQYRSAIFFHNPKQKQKAESIIKKLNEELVYEKPVVTELTPFSVFYKAEDYHQDYYKKNPENPYCQFVIRPKLEKFKKVFKNQLKE